MNNKKSLNPKKGIAKLQIQKAIATVIMLTKSISWLINSCRVIGLSGFLDWIPSIVVVALNSKVGRERELTRPLKYLNSLTSQAMIDAPQ